MTTYFDDLQGWLTDLEQAERYPDNLQRRIHNTRPFWTLDHQELEDDGWRAYLATAEGIGFAVATAEGRGSALATVAPVIVQAIEAKMRRDLRYLDAALYAMTGSPAQGFPHLWRNHPPHEDPIPEDLAPAAQRVARLCSAAHDLMHALATAYGISDNPATAAEQAMDREGGRL